MMHQKAHQAGFTLVELLVGVALGLFLTIAVIQSYLSTKATYQTTQNINRVQEDSRFAYHILTKDLRQTTSSGCLRTIRDMDPASNGLTDLSIKVGGWDFDNTSPGNEIDLTGTYAVGTSKGDWSGLNTGSNDRLPGTIDSIELSDAILVKKIAPIPGAVVNATTDNTSISITVDNANRPRTNQTLIVGNCFKADKFVVGGVSGSGTTRTFTATGSAEFFSDWGNDATVYSVSNVVYYVGLRNGSSVPSLFRRDFSKRPVNTGQVEELVENIESMQVLYGVDSSGDGYANRYVSAGDITDWRQIVSVRAGFLYVAQNAKTADSVPSQELYDVAGGISFKAAAGDNDLRYVSTITVKTRNLGLTEDFNVCAASDNTTTCNTIGYVTTTP